MMYSSISFYSPQWEKASPVEQSPKRPMNHLAVDCVGCCSEMTIVEREGQTLVQSRGNPNGFETLRLKSFNVAVRIRTLKEPCPCVMPFGGAKLFRRLLVLGEHVLAAHPQHVVHRVPKFTESVELRVVKLDRRGSYTRIWAALFALNHVFGSLGEVAQTCVAKIPVTCSIEVNYLRFLDQLEEFGLRQAEGGQVE